MVLNTFLLPYRGPDRNQTHFENAVVKRYMNRYCIKAAQIFVKFLRMLQVSNTESANLWVKGVHALSRHSRY